MLGIDLGEVSVDVAALNAEFREYRRAMVALKEAQRIYVRHLRKALAAADRMHKIDEEWRSRPGTFENRLVNDLARTGRSRHTVHGFGAIAEILSLFERDQKSEDE